MDSSGIKISIRPFFNWKILGFNVNFRLSRTKVMPKLMCNKTFFLPSGSIVLSLQEMRIPKKFSEKAEQVAVAIEMIMSISDLSDFRVFKYTISARSLNSYLRATVTVWSGQAVLFSCWNKPSEGSGTDLQHDLKDNRNLTIVNLHFGNAMEAKRSAMVEELCLILLLSH